MPPCPDPWARGFSATAINGDVAQNVRERTVNQLKSGDLDILVATDVAARGLDVERISHVVNYDIPTDTESYVHRIGRTGRAGRSGDAISFITPRERYLLKHIEKATRQPLTQMTWPSVEDVNTTRLARFDDQITEALQATDRIEGFREIVAHYVREHDVPEVDVAAALAVVAQGNEPLLLDPAAEKPRRTERPVRAERPDRSAGTKPSWGDRAEHGDQPERGAKRDRPARPSHVTFASYRINVGMRHKVEPRQIVGAIANEGGLSRSDFGVITIRPDFSLVELPTDLAPAVWDKLRTTRISGRLIDLAKEDGTRGSTKSIEDRAVRRPRQKG
ncbi:hypothetical protein FGL98_24690 [Leekyejoonella antrihumi]|uniref:RNA helicase n=1 Tax=Leekyejoonella antrihumi TaxID=1660198 RepID=A0A563DP97_9MICO|nr:hypothetical protein FGL98_24690 [Leekyejoonella antrihumi]